MPPIRPMILKKTPQFSLCVYGERVGFDDKNDRVGVGLQLVEFVVGEDYAKSRRGIKCG
jgi:hypothetical protein